MGYPSKEINGTAVQMTKPVVKLTSFHLCGKKPTEGEAETKVETKELAA